MRKGVNDMPKVSVIVPVYNVEKYLAACMDSILAQTLQDIEVICVDDGSTDLCPAILDAYAAQDNRVNVIHRQNTGYGAAMNAGIDAATGEYIGIVESDDCILPEMYETLYRHASAYDLDIVKSDAFYWLSVCDYMFRIHKTNLDNYYDRVLGEKDRKLFHGFYMNTWTGIYRRGFLEEFQIRHNETPGASFQDNGFWIQTISFCRNAMWLNQAFYLYRQDNPMASIKSRINIYAMSDEYDYLEKTLKEKSAAKESIDLCNYYRLLRHRGTFKRIADEYKREFCNKAIEDYERYSELLWNNEGLKKWFMDVMADPDGYCHRFIIGKEHLDEKLKNSDSIVIYGYGNFGQIVFRYLGSHGFYDRISCFMSSEKAAVPEIAGIPIRTLSEEAEICKKLIILSVSEKSDAYREISALLNKVGVTEWINAGDIIQYCYLV